MIKSALRGLIKHIKNALGLYPFCKYLTCAWNNNKKCTQFNLTNYHICINTLEKGGYRV